jgi:hypothetical protein
MSGRNHPPERRDPAPVMPHQPDQLSRTDRIVLTLGLLVVAAIFAVAIYRLGNW